MSQYNQPAYVSSNSSQSLNQQQQQPLSNLPPQNQNGPIYVSSNVNTGLPNSASNNSVYASQQSVTMNAPIPPPVPIYGQSNGVSNASMSNGYGGQQTQQQQPQPPSQQQQQFVPVPPQMPPVAPPPPPFNAGFANGNSSQTSSSSAPAAAPPPPPPPMAGLNNAGGGMDMSSLAAQLQQAKLKRNTKTNPSPAPPTENSGSSTSSGGSGNYGTIGRTSTGMASMMDEMAKTLARRRAQAEKKPEVIIILFYFKGFKLNCDFNFQFFFHAFNSLNQQTINNVLGKNQIHYHIN